MNERCYHYLEVCRGRYLCVTHGGFCDSSDGYAAKCPLCEVAESAEWRVNPIDRALQILGNLQSRSARNLKLVTGGLAALIALKTLVEAIDGEWSAPGQTLGFVIILILVAIASYMVSLAHMKTVQNGRFGRKCLDEWENSISKYVGRSEISHRVGGVSVLLALFLAMLSVLNGPIGVDLPQFRVGSESSASSSSSAPVNAENN